MISTGSLIRSLVVKITAIESFFLKKVIFLLVALVLIIFTAAYFKPSLTKDVIFIDSRGVVKNVSLPYSLESAPAGYYAFNGKISNNWPLMASGIIHVVTDDCLTKLTINKEEVPINELHGDELCDYDRGFILNAGGFLEKGDNDFEAIIKNNGGRFGLAFYSVGDYVLFSVAVFLFVIIAVLILLKEDIKQKNYIDNRIILITATLAALLLRLFLIPHISMDYGGFLSHWYDNIYDNGRVSFKEKFSDYSPFYLYLMGVSALLPISKLFAIKLISIVFDFFGAAFVYKIVKEKYKNNLFIPVSAYAVFLFAPTVFLNSAFWGQCDIIFTSFILASIYFLMRNKNIFSMFFYGLAFAAKLQAVFLLPLYAIILLRDRKKIWQTVIIPIVYFLTILPSYFVGRPLKDLFLIYLDQAGQYGGNLSLNAPTIYKWFPDSLFAELSVMGAVFAICLTAVLAVLIWRITMSKGLDSNGLVIIALMFSLVIPFILPKMHERYFFLADAISIVYAFYFPKRFYVPVIVILSSFFSYGPFLLGMEIIPLKFLSLAILVSILIVAYDFGNKFFGIKIINNPE